MSVGYDPSFVKRQRKQEGMGKDVRGGEKGEGGGCVYVL